MRVGAMVVGILFAIWTFFEALLIGGLGSMGEDEDIQALAGGGLFASLFIGVGAVLVLSVPQVSLVLFAIGGVISYISAAGGYSNHWVYGTIFFGLAIMAYFGWRGKKRDKLEKDTQNQRFEYLLASQGSDGGGMSAAMAGLDQSTRILLANNLAAREEILVTVRGKTTTVVASSSGVTLIPIPRKGNDTVTVQHFKYENMGSTKVETTNRGAQFIVTDFSAPYRVDLADQNQIDQAIRAVTIIRQKIDEHARKPLDAEASETVVL